MKFTISWASAILIMLMIFTGWFLVCHYLWNCVSVTNSPKVFSYCLYNFKAEYFTPSSWNKMELEFLILSYDFFSVPTDSPTIESIDVLGSTDVEVTWTVDINPKCLCINKWRDWPTNICSILCICFLVKNPNLNKFKYQAYFKIV